MFDEQGSPRMYANILLSTDGSEVAREGVRQGIALAKALNAKVTVITVTESLPVDYGSGPASLRIETVEAGPVLGGWIPSQEEIDRFDAACKERAGKVLDEARAMADEVGISAELLHVPNGYPAAAIIETAKSRGCDLIVMASHGRRGLKKLFLGSQTSEVLADGSVPVLVVPGGHS
jgi:nucleotide-binding universal stress UspA family protein